MISKLNMSEKKVFLSSSLAILLLILSVALSFFDKGYAESLWLIFQIYIFASLGLVIYWVSYKHKNLIINRNLGTLFAAYIIWLILAPYWSTWFDISRLTSWVLLLTPVSFFIASYVNLTKQHKKFIYVMYMCFGAFLLLWSSLHFFVTSSRPSGPLNDPNVLSGLILFFILPVIHFTVFNNRVNSQQKRIYVYSHLYLLFGFFAFFATGSRSGLIAFVVIMLLIVLKVIKDLRIKKISELLIIFFVMLCALFFSLQQQNHFKDRGVTSLIEDGAVQSRIEILKSSIDIVQDNSLLGSGLGTFPIQYKRYRSNNEVSSSGQYLHNDYLQFLVEGGLPQFIFIVLLSVIIIFIYFKLFFAKSSAENNHENLFKLTLLSIICAFFIQANANFVFYMAPNAILIGIILAYVSKDELFTTTSFTLKKSARIIAIPVISISLLLFAVDLHIQTKFYATPNTMSEQQASEYYKSSVSFSKIRPNSKPLSRFQFLYNLKRLSDGNNFEETHATLNSFLKKNPNDSFALHFLARFAIDQPSKYSILKERFSQSGYYEEPMALFYNSLKDDPGLLPSYFQLRLLYIENNQREEAYALFKEKLLPRFNFGEIPLINQIPIVETMLEDAEELFLVNDVVEYASLLLHIDTCNELALKAIGASKPEKCTLRFRN